MKIKVYTSITNSHDPARDDITVLTPPTSYFKDKPLQTARMFKALAPRILFPEYDWTIWVDGNVFLNVTPEELVEKCGDQHYGVFTHFHNSNLIQEQQAIANAYPEHSWSSSLALELYTSEERRQLPVAMTMVLVRRNHHLTIDASNHWWNLITKTDCYRDQMTFPRAFLPLGPYWETVDFTQPNEYFTRVS
jgi:hypothetical protein